MAKYLHMNGTSDVLTLPSMTLDKIVIDFKVVEPMGQISSIVVIRYGRQAYSLAYFNDNFSSSGFPSSIPFNERIVLESTFNTSTNASVIYVLSPESITSGAKGDIHSVICYLGGNIIAKYDMTTGTVQDVSGNGRHATLTGGTWLDDDAGNQPNPPLPNIVNITKSTISDEPDMDRSIITFTFDQDVVEWTTNVLGSSWDSGIVADHGGNVSAGTEVNAEVDWTELYQEGENRINIYGKNSDGYWTPYSD